MQLAAATTPERYLAARSHSRIIF